MRPADRGPAVVTARTPVNDVALLARGCLASASCPHYYEQGRPCWPVGRFACSANSAESGSRLPKEQTVRKAGSRASFSQLLLPTLFSSRHALRKLDPSRVGESRTESLELRTSWVRSSECLGLTY